jgi:cytochrome c556
VKPAVVYAVHRALVAAALCGLACAPVLASGLVSPEKAIKARQASYYLMGTQMARINATIKGDLPMDKPSLQLSAEALELLGRLVADNFPPGSEQGAPTKAKPELWKEMAKFRQLQQASQAEATKLRTAVSGGDVELIKVAYGATAKSCKACHDAFKAQ